jgi:uncharacterized tellurite resistance protein B-like protein
MLDTLKNFFAQAVAPGLAAGGTASGHALQVATAALLLEMSRMDDSVDAAERAVVDAALRERFGLSDDELTRLLALADEEARQAPGYHPFTSLINKSCDATQKAAIVENLWRVAYADGRLDAHEQHFMRKIADLLYIPHGTYVAAKERARIAAEKPGA